MKSPLADGAHETLRDWREARHRLLQRGASTTSLHAWRVCTRRLMALEALLAPPSRLQRDAVATALHPAFHAAGRLRDTQIAIQQLKQRQLRHPEARRLLRRLRKDLPRQREQVTRRVRKISVHQLRQSVKSWSRPATAGEMRTLAGRAMRRFVRAQAQLATQARKAGSVELHALRLQVKQVRYMRELLQRLRLAPRRERSLPALVRLQSALGAVTDLAELRHVVTRHAARHAGWGRKTQDLQRELALEEVAVRERALALAADLHRLLAASPPRAARA